MPAADKVMLSILVAIVLVGVARFAVVSARFASVAAGRDAAPATQSLRLSAVPAFVAWWGGRPVPRADGDDYLAAMRPRSAVRTLGPTLGTVIERQKARGVAITQVVVPTDNSALLGGRTGAVFTTAEGRTASTQWAPVGIAAANLTATPLVERDYPPVLTDAQAAAIESRTPMTVATRRFRVGNPVTSGSGAWVLYARPKVNGRSEFWLVPVEAAPHEVSP